MNNKNIAKRTAAWMITLMMCISFASLPAFADRAYPVSGKGQYMTDKTISTITITGVTAPVHGAKISDNFTVAEARLTADIANSGWWDAAAEKWVSAAETFEVDKLYIFKAFVTPKTGYSFVSDSAADMTGTINGQAAEVTLGSGGSRCVSYQFKCAAAPAETLKEVRLYVDAPKIGEKPDTASGTSTYDYVGASASWSPADEVFKARVAYTCTTNAEIDYFEGVFDENVKVYINDNEGVLGAFADDKKTITVSYTFPALAKEEHTHAYGNEWNFDANEHWRECECRDKAYKSVHDFKDGVCNVCGYKKSPDYKFPFTDVPDSAWFRGDVETAHKNGLINGKTETLYCPDDLMTYAEAIKLAASMNQLHYDGKVTLKSGDTQWYSTYMAYALEKGIIAEDMSLIADKSITRRDFVKIFRASMPASEFPAVNEVADGKIPDVAMNADGAAQIYDFYRAGILVGSDAAGTFNPDSNIVRSEVAAILTRMFDNTARKAITFK